VVQARTGSSRLPKKMIRHFVGKKSLLEYVLCGLLRDFDPDLIVVATSSLEADQAIVQIAQSLGVRYHAGDALDVRSRFIEIGRLMSTPSLVRICADNPFIQNQFIKELLSKWRKGPLDYLSYKFSEGTPCIRTHTGLFAEVVSVDALIRASEASDLATYKEHVTNFLYENPTKFLIDFIEAPELIDNRWDIRLTIDTETDFNNCQKIVSKIKQDSSLQDLLSFIDSNSKIKALMKNQIDQNSK